MLGEEKEKKMEMKDRRMKGESEGGRKIKESEIYEKKRNVMITGEKRKRRWREWKKAGSIRARNKV